MAVDLLILDVICCLRLRHDNLSDPFYSKSKAGWWKRRHVRMAKTFLKPIAYYKKKDDQSEYTLVYVNIMSGITHQIRITMQSLGHPLVSDDRYLPREQAIADCQWCPRNFLCEVRQDWFDMNGPYKNPERRRYSRISVENPLPKLFQDILEKKLELLQKLDTTADVYGGLRAAFRKGLFLFDVICCHDGFYFFHVSVVVLLILFPAQRFFSFHSFTPKRLRLSILGSRG